MNNILRWLWSLVAATLGATVLGTVYFSLHFGLPHHDKGFVWVVAFGAFVVSLGHVVCLGAPGSLLLWQMRKVTRHSMCVFGCLAGGVPAGMTTWPLKGVFKTADEAGAGGAGVVGVFAHGPALQRWSGFGEAVVTLGALGALGAFAGLAFWLAWDGWAFARDDDDD